MGWSLILWKYWPHILGFTLLISLTSCIGCQRSQIKSLKKDLAESALAIAVAKDSHESCRAALDSAHEALTRWRDEATLASSRAENAERKLLSLQNRHSRETEELHQNINELNEALNQVPVEDRCEEAATWAAQRYREIVGGG